MPATLSPQAFVARWKGVTLSERAMAQSHFVDLCRLLDHPTPVEADPTGQWYTFEAGVAKIGGGDGWADVWKRGHFGWEYKGKHANLERAYQQLLQYREALENPPLLVVCDIERIVVHTNYTNTVKQTYTITLDDLLTPQGRDRLHAVFRDPESLRAAQTTEQVTTEAAQKFALLADHLRRQGHAPDRVAHFLIRLLFCLFAEDIDLLPKGLFTEMVASARSDPHDFAEMLLGLFGAMAKGGRFGTARIHHFNGGLFDDATVLELDVTGLNILHSITHLDWGSIEPSILGTLFERSLDPGKRAMLGAHYTSKEDILLIVEPVLMAPLRRAWAATQSQMAAETAKRDQAIEEWQGRTDRTADAKRSQIQAIRTRSESQINGLLLPLLDQVRAIRVLDPACGSGNFLYIALRQLLDLEKKMIAAAAGAGLGGLFPQVNPGQLYGIEINEYAHELAQATVWIGWIQWLHENGYGVPSEPILKPLDNIRQMDAILAYNAAGKPVEPAWPQAEIIIGNPPFLGGSKLRRELGDRYSEDLWGLYHDRIPRAADLVTYWFERARAYIYGAHVQRVGLLATQAIRAGASRKVLERIKVTGDIFMAWSDRPWVLDGAAVRVSMIGFDDGQEQQRRVDGEVVSAINSDLTADIDLTSVYRLPENRNIVFKGTSKAGPFELDAYAARRMLAASGNPNRRPNSDVIKPWFSGSDVVGRWRELWLIDFGIGMSEDVAAMYELPFEYVKKHVFPIRSQNRRTSYAEKWWQHAEARPGMRTAIARLQRFIVTPRVAKHRTFVWLDAKFLPDDRLYVFARDDDYFFGVLHSRIHELWSLATSSRHGVGNDPTYNNTTCFETFPFPWPPGQEPVDDPRVQAIAGAARALNAKREAWLNPPGASAADLKKRTLTNLYNARPTWLALAHDALDQAVFAAYGWPPDLSDEDILARLLALNLERSRQTA